MVSRVFMICDRYESGYGHGWNQDGFDLSKTPHSDAEMGEAYQLGYESGSRQRDRYNGSRPGVARIIRKRKKERPAGCRWRQDGDPLEGESWYTDCGDRYVFIEGGPKENNHKFCHRRGKRLLISESHKPDVLPASVFNYDKSLPVRR